METKEIEVVVGDGMGSLGMFAVFSLSNPSCPDSSRVSTKKVCLLHQKLTSEGEGRRML
jgi:hypothetical protein